MLCITVRNSIPAVWVCVCVCRMITLKMLTANSCLTLAALTHTRTHLASASHHLPPAPHDLSSFPLPSLSLSLSPLFLSSVPHSLFFSTFLYRTVKPGGTRTNDDDRDNRKRVQTPSGIARLVSLVNQECNVFVLRFFKRKKKKKAKIWAWSPWLDTSRTHDVCIFISSLS